MSEGRTGGAPGPAVLRAAFAVVWGLALLLRLALPLVNSEANDSHVEVVQRILATGSLPIKTDCWECFQPKLYHASLALLFVTLDLSEWRSQVLAANLFNAGVGVLVLLVCWRLLAPSRADAPWLAWLAFALLALNPKLIAISSQATNDIVVVLFSVLALAAALRFLNEDRAGDLAWAAAWVVLAVSAKSNGWVIFLALVGALLVRAVVDAPARRRTLVAALLVAIAVPAAAALNPLNQLRLNLQRFGSPVALNIRRAPPPQLFASSYVPRAGVLSVADGFLTFKLRSLLAHPRIENGMAPVPAHRTSLWTQLYGRAHSLHFDNWPPTWGTQGEAHFPRLRALFLLALVPTALLVAGAMTQVGACLRGLLARDAAGLARQNFALLPLAFFGCLAAIACYAYLYREYSVMKAIFLLPALPALPAAFLAGARRLPARVVPWLFAAALPLLALYVAEVVVLVCRLL